MLSISDIPVKFKTFRMEKVCFPRITKAGGETQMTKPVPGDDEHQIWTIVQPTSAAYESTVQMGAAYVFGFNLDRARNMRNRARSPDPNPPNPHFKF